MRIVNYRRLLFSNAAPIQFGGIAIEAIGASVTVVKRLGNLSCPLPGQHDVDEEAAERNDGARAKPKQKVAQLLGLLLLSFLILDLYT